MQSEHEKGKAKYNEFDLLEVAIDPSDSVAFRMKHKLQEEVAAEVTRIRIKALFKASKDNSNPMKIDL